jgi:cytochrome b6-f complex iron-sulfur subunit
MKKSVPDKDTIKNSGRRSFLKQAWKILGLVAAAELGVFVISVFKPSRELHKSRKSSTIKTIGNVDDFPVNSVTPDRINKLYLIRESDGGFLALSLTCPHLGCSVLWNETKKQFICPCHSSSFDRVGNVLGSPAPRPLDFFPIIIQEGKVTLDISLKTKRRRFEKKQLTYAI